MRITADWQGRDDECTGTEDDQITVRYYSEEEGEDYFYEMYVLVDDEKARVIVTPHGVSVDFWEGRTIHTNLVPMKMFPGLKTLEWDQLNKILIVLRRTGIEGKTYSKEEMQERYERWLKEEGHEFKDD